MRVNMSSWKSSGLFFVETLIVRASKQTTMSHRDCDFQNWKSRDYQVGDKVRNGNETKSRDRSGAHDQCCSPTAKTGLSGQAVQAGQRAADTAPSLPPRTSFGPQPVNSQAALLSSAHLSSARFHDTAGGVQTAVYRSSSTSSHYFVSSRSKESVPNCEEGEDSSTVHDINEYGDIKKETECIINVSEHDTIGLNLDQQTPDARTARECSEDFCGENVSSNDGSKNSEDCLRVPDIYYHGGNSSAPNFTLSIPNSIATSQFRRLESRRGSSVTFILPAHVSSGDNSTQTSSRQQSICTEEGAQLQERFHNLYSRRMSAPELPPIAGDRERLRPGSHRSCYNQLSVSPNPRTLPPAPRTIPRNDSDGSLRGLTTRSQGPTHSSGSVVSYGGWGGGGVAGEGGRGDVAVLGGKERCLTPHQRSSSRALSWSTTDNSGAGSALRLETLFEQNHGLPRGASVTSLTVPDVQLSSQRSLVALPARSVSVNGLSPFEARALARLRMRKKLHSECGVLETVGTIEHFSRLRSNGMRRAVSENKLSDNRNNAQLDNRNNAQLDNRNNAQLDKRNARNARIGVSSSSHHISVSRTTKLTHRKPSGRPAGTASANMAATNGVMRATGGAPAINSVTAERQKTRLHSNRDSCHVEGESEDSEEEEERRERIREWLEGLDCADVPPEPVIDYADDPPQTDTALHIVYQQD